MKKRWEEKSFNENDALFVSKSSGIPLSISKLMVANGLNNSTDALDFLNPDFRKLHNPFLMTDMQKSVDRILEAINKNEKIMVHGDYDADGVTTLAIFVEGFKLLGVDVDYYAPNRFKDGYGLNKNNMEPFSHEYDLIISGDTGIKAFEAGEIVSNIGKADLIITDHHEPLEGHIKKEILDNLNRKKHSLSDEEVSEEVKEKNKKSLSQFDFLLPNFHLEDYSSKEIINFLYELEVVPFNSDIELLNDKFIALPKAYSVLNPKRLGDKYPCKSLSGVAVVFKLFQALLIQLRKPLKPLLSLLDIVSVGLVADLVQQIDKKVEENGYYNDMEVRVMTYFGLKLMNTAPKTWVKTMSSVSGIKLDEKEEILSSHLGFRFGPMLNAPGRLYDPKISVEILLEKDYDKSLELANELKSINSERQSQIEVYKNISSELKSKGEEYYDYGIVVENDSFHIGVAGLIAGKLCEEYYRPSIALAPLETEKGIVYKGSARSIPGISVVEMLGLVQKDIGKFEHGGHEQAAGMTLMPEQIDAFRESFRKYCSNHSEETFTPLMRYNAEITIDDIFENVENYKIPADQIPFLKFLKKLEPFGQENLEPIFRINNLTISDLKPIMEGKGYRLTFETNCGEISGISFKDGEEIIETYKDFLSQGKEPLVNILTNVSINTWNGKNTLQFMIKDMKFL